MAKGDVGSQQYAQQAQNSVPQFGQARGGIPGMGMGMGGGGFGNMLMQMAMRNQMQQPQMQYQGFPGQQMNYGGGGGKGSPIGNAARRAMPGIQHDWGSVLKPDYPRSDNGTDSWRMLNRDPNNGSWMNRDPSRFDGFNRDPSRMGRSHVIGPNYQQEVDAYRNANPGRNMGPTQDPSGGIMKPTVQPPLTGGGGNVGPSITKKRNMLGGQ